MASAGDDRQTADAWVTALLRWYHERRRVLPWREAPTPYRVWLSEIMLQQTQVATVQPYFERFVRQFPDLETLAAADLQAVLKAWEGLGYYRRARLLHQTARILMAEGGGRLPATVAALRALPGIGAYTAAAIASIAFGLPVPAIDGNVIRVGARLWARSEPASSTRLRRELEARLQPAIVASGDPAAFTQALMELGARVCAARQPACSECPLAATCLARAQGRTAVLPVRRPRAPVPHYRVAVGLIEDRGRVLIARRREDQMLGGLWEFPGGRREPGERLVDTVVREAREEVGLEVRVVRRLCTVRHAYSHFRITMTAFLCIPEDPAGELRAAAPTAWVPWAELDRYPFPKANHKIFAALGLAGAGRRHGPVASPAVGLTRGQGTVPRLGSAPPSPAVGLTRGQGTVPRLGSAPPSPAETGPRFRGRRASGGSRPGPGAGPAGQAPDRLPASRR